MSTSEFAVRDRQLIALGVGERTIAGRLAMYLAPLFPQHDVDLEYNRHGVDTKRLARNPACRVNRKDPWRIYPDIIVHLRGVDHSNLLAIEIKPTSALPDEIDCDREKLAGLMEEYLYSHTLLLTFSRDEHSREDLFAFEWHSRELLEGGA